MISIHKINGKEIIDFLNAVTSQGDGVEDISTEGGGFVFESQSINGDRYKLVFSASFNDWGTSQDISGNELIVSEDDAWFYLEEPFDGDGTDDALIEVLLPWLRNHAFVSDKEEQFQKLIKGAQAELSEIRFDTATGLQSVIDKLIEAQSWV